jgi:hypothetical protein
MPAEEGEDELDYHSAEEGDMDDLLEAVIAE